MQLLGVECRPITGAPGYLVSRDGSVWSKQKNTKRTEQIGEWHRVLGGTDKDGYRKVIICRGGRRRYARVSTLVLEAFVGPRPDGLVAAHENGVCDDDRAENLRWSTQKDNIGDKRAHGTWQEGERCGTAILSREQASRILSLKGESDCRSVAEQFGISRQTVYAIWSRRLWKCLDA